MGKADAVMVVGRMMAAFRQEKVSDEAVAVYAEELADIPAALLIAAAKELIATATFFPAVGEIRRTVARLCGLLPPSGAELVAMIRRADVRESVYRRDGSFAYEERYWRWPEEADPRAIELAQDMLEKVGEPCDPAGKDYFAWETDFKKTYEPIYEVHARFALADLSRAALPAPSVAQLPRPAKQLTVNSQDPRAAAMLRNLEDHMGGAL